MKSLATRLSLRFAGVFAMLLFGVVAFTSLIIVASANKTAQGSIASAEVDIRQLAHLYAASHRTLVEAAPAIVQSVSAHQVRIAVFDKDGKLLAGDGSLATTATPQYFNRIDVAGGSVAIAPAGNIGQGLLAYWLLMILLGGLGLIVAWLVGRSLAAQSLRPVADVTAALSKLAEGDFSRRTFIMEERSEVGSLASAYNAAADKVAAVFAHRDSIEARMRQFIADAGHELRTPLTVMMGYVDVLRRGAVREEELAVKILDTMGAEGVRMRALIDELLTLARLEDVGQPDIASVDVAGVVGDVVESMRKSAPDRVLTWTAAPGVKALADESELRSAIVNLIDNALKYAPESPVDVSVKQTGKEVALTVVDSGPGMNARECAHAFDRFFRGDNREATAGAGLGLAIVKRTAERAGGSVDLETVPGAGARITLRLRAG